MELNEIKKTLYKENTTAHFQCILKGVAIYQCVCDTNTLVVFQVPVNDMGDASFKREMDAKLLIRYIVK